MQSCMWSLLLSVVNKKGMFKPMQVVFHSPNPNQCMTLNVNRFTTNIL